MEYRDACRLCLCEEEVAVNIFEYGEDELSHCQTIEEIFNIKLLELPNLPSMACLRCIRKLNRAALLREKINSSQMTLFEYDTLHYQTNIEPLLATINPMDIMEISSSSDSPDNKADVEWCPNIESAAESEAEVSIEAETDPPPDESQLELTNDRENWTCNVCDSTFLSPAQLDDHNCPGVTVFQAETETSNAEETSSTEPDLQLLEGELLKRNLLNCRDCDAKNPSLQSHNKHYRDVHSRDGYILCCGMVFRNKDALSHMEYHLDNNTFKCSECKKIFLSLIRFRRHQNGSCAPRDDTNKTESCTCLACERHFLSSKEFEDHECVGVTIKRSSKANSEGIAVDSEPDQEVLDNELRKRNLLTCHECQTPTDSFKDLMMHMGSVHDKNGFAICCNKRFFNHHLLEHMRFHVEKLKCPGCKEVLGSVEKLRLHKLSCGSLNDTPLPNKEELEEEMRNRNLLVCQICTWSEAESFEQLMDHMKDVHSETGYILCCNVKFDSSTVFQHIQFHLNEDLFKCKECGKRAASQILLDAHFRRHHIKRKQKLFPCQTCGKKLRSVFSLQNHYKTHLGPGNFEFICEICGKGYHLKGQMLLHTKTHREKKTEQCPICGKHYFSLKVHIQTQHSNKKKDKCEICGFETAYLKRHMAQSHVEAKFGCRYDSCGKAFKSAGLLGDHMKTHEGVRHECTYCDYTANHGRVITAHMKVKHPAGYADYIAQKYSEPRTSKGK